MVQWKKLFSANGNSEHRHLRDEMRRFLPTSENDTLHSAIPPRVVTQIALRLRYQISAIIPCELEEWKITKANSPIITKKVILTAKSAGGAHHSSCVIYCLLVCNRWFRRQAMLELWDADMHNARATAAEVLAKHIIEMEEDETYLLEELLLKRYSILINGEQTEPANAIERAVDLHCLRVIGSSGYQKCISYLWRGWLVQDDEDPSRFVPYEHKASTEYRVHLDPDRMRTPLYQNAVQVFFSVLYLVLYTLAINSINHTGDLDVVEGVLYLMTAGFLFDELAKFYKVGRFYIGFWNVFNLVLYALLCTSFVTRMIALGHPVGEAKREHFNELSYNFLAFSAPMFWMRLLLYLDTFRFFGAMLVVLKVMMKESLIFFALLVIVCVGFLQAFIGMDQVDDDAQVTAFIIQAMANSVMQSPDFTGFEKFAPPFGIILYYLFTFVVMVVLLNILVALYNSAYSDITDNAIDEYMALFAQKSLQFVRAPDENVFIAPFNLLEIFLLILPFEWWLPTARYERLNNYVMGIIYSPLLLITAWLETKQARKVKHNRRHGESDEDTTEEWEQGVGSEMDFEGEGWAKKVESTRPNVETDAAVLEIREVMGKVEYLTKVVEGLKREKGVGVEDGKS
ncbi:calcium channel YVC1 [Physcia stellaris]|nr:calcium channel YVC1 [Physcia stellaris]